MGKRPGFWLIARSVVGQFSRLMLLKRRSLVEEIRKRCIYAWHVSVSHGKDKKMAKSMSQLRDEIYDLAKGCHIRVYTEMLSYELYPDQECRRLELRSVYTNTAKQAKLLQKLAKED